VLAVDLPAENETFFLQPSSSCPRKFLAQRLGDQAVDTTAVELPQLGGAVLFLVGIPTFYHGQKKLGKTAPGRLLQKPFSDRHTVNRKEKLDSSNVGRIKVGSSAKSFGMIVTMLSNSQDAIHKRLTL
jgi:hypothetical protein